MFIFPYQRLKNNVKKELNSYMKKLFGKRLREIRIERGLTQEKTAELIGIKPENYSRLENGFAFPKPENIEKLSKVLNVRVCELFEFEHQKDYETILNEIITKLSQDKETTALTYKFLKSLGRI
jgi:transcriptional regulator with XRE-family HTH domain